MQWLAGIKSHRRTTTLQSMGSQERASRALGAAQRINVLRTIEEPSSQGMLKDLEQLKARAFGCAAGCPAAEQERVGQPVPPIRA